jgi:hypothetical protein
VPAVAAVPLAAAPAGGATPAAAGEAPAAAAGVAPVAAPAAPAAGARRISQPTAQRQRRSRE